MMEENRKPSIEYHRGFIIIRIGGQEYLPFSPSSFISFITHITGSYSFVFHTHQRSISPP